VVWGLHASVEQFNVAAGLLNLLAGGGLKKAQDLGLDQQAIVTTDICSGGGAPTEMGICVVILCHGNGLEQLSFF
jgi:hypothetical protein